MRKRFVFICKMSRTFGEIEAGWLNRGSVVLGFVPRVFTNVCLTGGKFTGRGNAQNLR